MNKPTLPKRTRQAISALGVGMALLLLLALVFTGTIHAQGSATATPTPTATATATATRTRNAVATATRTVSPTAALTATTDLTATVTLTPTRRVQPTRTAITPTVTLTATPTPAIVPVTVTVVVTVTSVPTASSDIITPTATAGPPVVELLETEILTGTILANRSEVTTTFFLEGRLYELPPLRSTSAVLQRPLTVLTLYNCQVGTAESQDCFWDPYPVRQDGFYEIVNGAEVDAPLSLLLQEAAPPPDDQIWIQNRTGHLERFLYSGNLFELANSNVLELTLAEPTGEGEIPVGDLYLRRCLGLADRAVCEWLPQPVVGGVYYAMIDETTLGVLPDSVITTIRLDLVLGAERLAALVTPTPEPTPTPPPPVDTPTPEPTAVVVAEGAVFCRTQVPRLNVRGGPGTEYVVVAQVAQDNAEGGRFAVVGRNSAGDWLAVDPSVAAGGWVINTPQFIVCEGATDGLAVTPVSDGRLAEPTPVPAAADAAASDAAADSAEGEATATPETTTAGIPPGQAQLIVTNAFDQDVRFTLSVREHGLPEGSPSEYDLKPGDSISFIIRAGRVQFSASSPFRNSSGNAEFFLDEGASRELFLRFFPSAGDPNKWDLQWE